MNQDPSLPSIPFILRFTGQLITLSLCLGVLLLTGCTSVPDGVKPVDDFQLNRYLGKWYEIARLDHSFERGLTQVTAEYELQDDGSVVVINRGFDGENNEWKEAKGRAYFVGDSDIGHLKVSFFGPFYASYIIAELDKGGYQYALVTGPDHDYLWILSRHPELSEDVTSQLMQKGKKWGFDTDSLIYVEQSHNK
jgi:apolipoprotein D and lipocalin family protein